MDITDSGLNNLLLRCRGGLKELDLQLTPISGEGITATLPQLQKLCLLSCSDITDSGLDNILLKWGDALRELDLNETDLFDDRITEQFPHLHIIKCFC